MKVSLIISTYNSPDRLRVTLDSVLTQTRFPDEVIIADDGSEDATHAIVAEFQKLAPFPIIYVWQPDEGFRLAMIRNKAIAQSTGDYIIQIDGDIMLHPSFVEDHEKEATPGTFACGSRVLVEKEQTMKILEAGKAKLLSPFSKGIRNRKNAIRSGALKKFFQLLPGMKLKYRGCNMAFWREDLVKVNGYDEGFLGWGCEDHELVARLTNANVRAKQLRNCALCFHLWHPSGKTDDGSFERNNRLLEQSRAQHRIEAQKGLNKYLISPAKAPKL